jgi:hypothetical protein
MPIEDYFTPGSREWYEAKLYGIGNGNASVGANANALAETALGIAPGSGEAMSARDAWQASGRGANALAQGQYGQAAGEYANMLAAMAGAVPGAGVIARGTKRGAAWMERNLPKGVNALADRMMPSDPANTAFAIPAWHGSAHDFDKFDMSKVGTGEGAQAYGHGLYFAEKPEVARSYRDALSPFTLNGESITDDMMLGTFARAKLEGRLDASEGAARNRLQRLISRPMAGDEAVANQQKAIVEAEGELDKIDRVKSGEVSRTGRIYRTELDVEPEQLLDWDKPLSKQPNGVKTALLKFAEERGREGEIGRWLKDDSSWFTGGRFYEVMKNLGETQDQFAASLNKAGIPGVRYLDQFSRGADGTSNYVIFDDKLIKITGKE